METIKAAEVILQSLLMSLKMANISAQCPKKNLNQERS